LEPNYRYVIDKSRELTSGEGPRILDYGCGLGEIVEQGRREGADIYGVERFYGGSNIRESVIERGLFGDVIRELDDDGTIPFDSEYFDLVVSNQVFEHVEELEPVVREIGRVLKKGGKFLCLFPSKDVIREGHCGVPMVHWIPKQSRFRYYWLLLFRSMGFGYHKGDKTRRQWSTDFHQWLNDYTHYRNRREINDTRGIVFDKVEPLEDDYMSYRLNLKGLSALGSFVRYPVANSLARFACRKLAGLVLVARKEELDMAGGAQ
jgi:SAM-dependent methyltransferase